MFRSQGTKREVRDSKGRRWRCILTSQGGGGTAPAPIDKVQLRCTSEGLPGIVVSVVAPLKWHELPESEIAQLVEAKLAKMRVFADAEGRYWHASLGAPDRGLSGSANLGPEALVFVAGDERRVIAGFGLGQGVTPFTELSDADLTRLLAQAKPEPRGR
jgi:hypothetical protein